MKDRESKQHIWTRFPMISAPVCTGRGRASIPGLHDVEATTVALQLACRAIRGASTGCKTGAGIMRTCQDVCLAFSITSSAGAGAGALM